MKSLDDKSKKAKSNELYLTFLANTSKRQLSVSSSRLAFPFIAHCVAATIANNVKEALKTSNAGTAFYPLQQEVRSARSLRASFMPQLLGFLGASWHLFVDTPFFSDLLDAKFAEFKLCAT